MNHRSKWLRRCRALLIVSTLCLAGHLYSGTAYALKWQRVGDVLLIWGDYVGRVGSDKVDVLIIRPHLEGQPGTSQYDVVPGDAHVIRNISPGQVYVVEYKYCARGGLPYPTTSCPDQWESSRYVVVDPASDLRGADISEWRGGLYNASIRLTWKPARGASYVTVRRRQPNYRYWWSGTSFWVDEKLPGNASSFELEHLEVGTWYFQVIAFDPQGPSFEGNGPDYSSQRYYGKVLETTVELPLPAPRAPARPIAVMSGTDQVRLVWRGDNVTQSYDIERLYWPSLASRLEQKFGTIIQEPGLPAPEPSRGGITAQPKIGAAANSLARGQSSPALKNQPSPGPSLVWLTALKVNKVGNDTREQIAIDQVKKTGISASLGGRMYEPYTYRVCAVNQTGRACSEAVEVMARRPSEQQLSGKPIANVFRMLSITPSVYGKANANPAQIVVTLRYTGGYPELAAYRSDDGAWVNTSAWVVNEGTARVVIPSSVFQNSSRSVEVKLGTASGEAVGTIAVMLYDPSAQPKNGKTLETTLQKGGPGTAKESPRTAEPPPKNIPALQQPVPGKGAESLFQR